MAAPFWAAFRSSSGKRSVSCTYVACGEREPCHVCRHEFRRHLMSCTPKKLLSFTVLWAVFLQMPMDRRDAVYTSCTLAECCQLVRAPWSAARLSCSWPDTHTHIQVVRWAFPQRGPCGTTRYQVTFTKRLTQSSGHCTKKASGTLYNASNVSCLQPQPLSCDPICVSVPRRFMKPLCKNGTILQLVGWLAFCTAVVKQWMVMWDTEGLFILIILCVFLFLLCFCFLFLFFLIAEISGQLFDFSVPSVNAVFHFYNTMIIVFVLQKRSAKTHVRNSC